MDNFPEAEGQIAFFQHNISGQLVHFSAKMKRVWALLVLISSEFIVQVTSSLVAGNLSCRYPEESVSSGLIIAGRCSRRTTY